MVAEAVDYRESYGLQIKTVREPRGPLFHTSVPPAGGHMCVNPVLAGGEGDGAARCGGALAIISAVCTTLCRHPVALLL